MSSAQLLGVRSGAVLQRELGLEVAVVDVLDEVKVGFSAECRRNQELSLEEGAEESNLSPTTSPTPAGQYGTEHKWH